MSRTVVPTYPQAWRVWALPIPLLLLFLNACASTKNYDRAKKTDTVEAYETFISQNPNALKYVKLARDRILQLRWDSAKKTNTVAAYQQFLSMCQDDSKCTQLATEALQDLECENIKMSTDIQLISKFVADHREHGCLGEVIRFRDRLQYEQYLAEDPKHSDRTFIMDFPQNLHVLAILFQQVKSIDSLRAWVEFAKLPNIDQSMRTEAAKAIERLNGRVTGGNLRFSVERRDTRWWERDLSNDEDFDAGRGLPAMGPAAEMRVDGQPAFSSQENLNILGGRKFWESTATVAPGDHTITCSYPPGNVYSKVDLGGEAKTQVTIHPFEILVVRCESDVRFVGKNWDDYVRRYDVRITHKLEKSTEDLSPEKAGKVKDVAYYVNYINNPGGRIGGHTHMTPDEERKLFAFALYLAKKYENTYPLYVYWIAFQATNNDYVQLIDRALSERENVHVFAAGLPFVDFTSQWMVTIDFNKERRDVLLDYKHDRKFDTRIPAGPNVLTVSYAVSGSSMFSMNAKTANYQKEVFLSPFDDLELVIYDGHGFKVYGLRNGPPRLDNPEINAYGRILERETGSSIPNTTEAFESETFWGNPATLKDIRDVLLSGNHHISPSVSMFLLRAASVRPGFEEDALRLGAELWADYLRTAEGSDR